MYETDLAHISIQYIYNIFYIQPFAAFKIKNMSKHSVS